MLLSVIIATYNRSETLRETFKSILGQKTAEAFDYEIIVVDNNSTDDTKSVVEKLQNGCRHRIRYFFEPQRGKSYAVNLGIKEALGDILVFTDDDVIVDAHWLVNIVHCFEKYNCDGLGGRILPQYPASAPQWIIDNKDLIVGPIVCYDYGEETRPYQKPILEFLGANFAFKKSLFNECGYFRTDIGPGMNILGEDTEITNRFLEAGKQLYYCGSAMVWHPVEDQRMTLKYITSWYWALGRYRIMVGKKNLLPKDEVYFFNIPSALVRRILMETGYLLTHIYSKRESLRAWVDLCVSFGKAAQIRKLRKIKDKVL